MPSMQRRQLLHLGWAAGMAGLLSTASANAAAAAASEPGTVLLMRHAQTDPGTGDPPGFALGQCSTQRNLSAEGRAQAKRIGVLLQQQGLGPQRVRSSAWCRCLDTATLAFGKVEPWEALNSFFEGGDTQGAQTAALRKALAAVPAGQVEVWVTHQVNITALTGVYPASGEVLVLRKGNAADGVPAVLRRIKG